MAKTIYTEEDIDNLGRRGVTEVCVNDDIYLTDLARERAEKLGLRLRIVTGTIAQAPTGEKEELVRRVKAGVIARLGGGMDEKVVENVIRKVVSQL